MGLLCILLLLISIIFRSYYIGDDVTCICSNFFVCLHLVKHVAVYTVFLVYCVIEFHEDFFFDWDLEGPFFELACIVQCLEINLASEVLGQSLNLFDVHRLIACSQESLLNKLIAFPEYHIDGMLTKINHRVSIEACFGKCFD